MSKYKNQVFVCVLTPDETMDTSTAAAVKKYPKLFIVYQQHPPRNTRRKGISKIYVSTDPVMNM